MDKKIIDALYNASEQFLKVIEASVAEKSKVVVSYCVYDGEDYNTGTTSSDSMCKTDTVGMLDLIKHLELCDLEVQEDKEY